MLHLLTSKDLELIDKTKPGGLNSPQNIAEAQCRKNLESLKDIVEYRSGPFMARFPEDANMAVIYKERLPELFTKKELNTGKS